MTFFPLYIDPGTGSALFSITIGIAAAAYFLARTFFLKLRVFLFHNTKTNESQYEYVIYAEDKRYWVFFKSILKEFEKRQIETLYLTSSADDPVFSSGFNFIQSKCIGRGNKAFAYLNFLSADIVLSTTPDLDVLQWKRSKTVRHYCHIIHAAGGSLLYRLFALDYYDSILLSGESEIQEIRYLENIRKL
ncbi:MAG: CDP-glycerol--glycerophosphate glycerophosphotransferase, partial [Treponema sp.]|nr:CDP-glycerol--glycerophosphate glycerophosphotransferase [Treponema sp.]